MRLSIFSPHTHHCHHYPIKLNHSPFTLFTHSSSSPPTRLRLPRIDAAAATTFYHHRRKDKVVVIMGATGSGKSRLSVDLATLFFPFSEILNSDKMQVYSGLDITTNKIPLHQRRGVTHHLLGDVNPDAGEFSPSDFRHRAGDIISDITSRRKLPIIVGGSNSFIHALLVERFDPELNVFDAESLSTPTSSSSPVISSELRYNCCFLWVDVSFPVLSEYLIKRVDDMLDSGMVDELAQFFDPHAIEEMNRTGLRKAIGVPELDRYFKEYPPGSGEEEDRVRKGAYKEAVRAIKDNTCQLAKRQIEKILRLKRAGWNLQRIDATDAFRAALTLDDRWSDIWERQVLEPSVNNLNRFLMD
ncbi:hypothetical protein Lal_00047728 [Lupinus albus]|uniref:adenylate dimethylallyltransferase (ADP/ATP-dependent) n=1 Tax=Lupinus albus TaxID=3870 RepID=A0A6A4QZF0_LUPAL|nr:putative transferase [Lupinus albus]KAF1879056.1 hypothetical protein Lal_00047728 [Lupinus albus]